MMDRLKGKRQLRRLRESRGWSWTDEARAIKSTAGQLSLDSAPATSISSVRRTIARWESEAATASVPDERYQWILAHLYAERNGALVIGPGSDFLALLAAFRDMGIAQDRIRELHSAITSWAGGKLTQPWRIDPTRIVNGDLAELSAALTTIVSEVGTMPFSRSQIALAPYLDAFQHLQQTGTEIPPDAHVLATRSFGSAGRLAFELRDDETARLYYDAALRHANKATDKMFAARVQTSLALITMHRDDNLASADRIIATAVKAAMGTPSMTARAKALAVQAEVAARRGLHQPAKSALELAEHYTAKAESNDPSGKPFDSARLSGFVGLHHLLTGDSWSAVVDLQNAASGIPEDHDPVQHSIVIADLAHAHLARPKPEPEAAALALRKCVTIIGKTRGRVATGRVMRVRRLLRPWAGERFLEDLDDHIYTVLFD
jgi:hypothetical protein